MLTTHRRWLVANALIATANINLILNTGIGFLQAAGHDHIPTWSTAVTHGSVLGGSLGTLFMLPLITCLLVSTAVHREQGAGELPPLETHPTGRPWSIVVGQSILRRGLRLGASTLLVLGLPVGITVALAFPHGLSHDNFVIYNVLFTIALGAVMTPLIAYLAMTDAVVTPGN